jgi:hypothetical protein
MLSYLSYNLTTVCNRLNGVFALGFRVFININKSVNRPNELTVPEHSEVFQIKMLINFPGKINSLAINPVNNFTRAFTKIRPLIPLQHYYAC